MRLPLIVAGGRESAADFQAVPIIGSGVVSTRCSLNVRKAAWASF